MDELTVNHPIILPTERIAALFERGALSLLRWGEFKSIQYEHAIAEELPGRPAYVWALFSRNPTRAEFHAPHFFIGTLYGHRSAQHALQIMHDRHPEEFMGLVAAHETQRTADLFVQLCLWHDVEYDLSTGKRLIS